MATLYAQPYNLGAAGSCFETTQEFKAKSESLTDCHGLPFEEFEIQLIDGYTEDAQLFDACGINQANLVV